MLFRSLKDICIGVPASIGKGGIIEIVELALTAEEDREFRDSAEAIRKTIGKV